VEIERGVDNDSFYINKLHGCIEEKSE